jgi:hypothetical protein
VDKIPCIKAYKNDRLGRSGLVPSKMNEDKRKLAIFSFELQLGDLHIYESARDVVPLYANTELPH